MEEKEILKIFLPSTITSNGFIIKNELLEPNLPKDDAQLGIVKHEHFYTGPHELQLKSKKPEVKVETVADDDMSIKLEPLISEELYIKDENEPTDQSFETITESGYYYCGLCNCKFSDKNILEQHLNPASKPLDCYKCDYKCIRKCLLEVHINKHLKGEDFERDKYNCVQKISLEQRAKEKALHFSEFASKVHQKCGQTPPAKPSFNCTICDYKCVRKDYLKKHMQIHTGDKPFNCDFCDYKTVKLSTLKKHVRIHTGEKPFKCVVCDYKTAQFGNLRIHMKIHTGEKPFNCDFCDYKAAQQSHMKQHVKTHTGEKPFKCAACDYRSARKESLRTHMKSHTGEKPLNCNFCDYKTADLSNFRKHVRIHTGEKPFKFSTRL